MAIWRLLGECPEVYTRQELETQSIDGWNPWREPFRLTGDYIVVPDPADLSRRLHVRVYDAHSDDCDQPFRLIATGAGRGAGSAVG
jgi:hypothetical protein